MNLNNLNLKGFIDLPLNDQMRLLQVSWAEILTLMVAHRSVPFTGRLYFASDFWLDEKTAKECGASDMYHHVSHFIIPFITKNHKLTYSSKFVHLTQRFERISASKEEYFLLKALALSNCDIRLDNPPALKKLRDTILNALNDCVLITR